jgi:pilus assembly protein Flp/PilA
VDSVLTTFFSFVDEYPPITAAQIPAKMKVLSYPFFISQRYGADVKSLMGATSMRTVSRFLRDDSGATAIEYGLIAAGIAIAIIAAVNALGTALSGKFDQIKTALK